jgi:GT2 family glycosyltransferase
LDYANYEVVVVDNGRPGEFRARLADAPQGLTLLENSTNLGFAGGCNVGIEFLLGRGADYVLLLNDDTQVSPTMLRVLVEEAERDPRVGLAGPKIYYHSQPNVIWSAGGALTDHGEPRHLRADEVDGASDEGVCDVDYVSGCALLARRELIEQIGLLDERFFAYFEETEWCARARRADFRIVFVPGARLWHKIEPGQRTHSPLYLYLMTRNRLLFLKCSGAKPTTILRAVNDLLRTAVSWSIKPRHREMRPFSLVIVRGVLDFAIGRFGPPPVGMVS